jgi:hypothetical protein
LSKKLTNSAENAKSPRLLYHVRANPVNPLLENILKTSVRTD